MGPLLAAYFPIFHLIFRFIFINLLQLCFYHNFLSVICYGCLQYCTINEDTESAAERSFIWDAAAV